MRSAVILAAGVLLIILSVFTVHGRGDGSPCEPNRCKNGGTCILKRGRGFKCTCPDGFAGKRCQKATDGSDCYNGNGESYDGNARKTEGGKKCLSWTSADIGEKVLNPFVDYPDLEDFEDFDDLDELDDSDRQFCRNPDGDVKPWCFYEEKSQLKWDYCNIKECSTSTSPTPTSNPNPNPSSTSNPNPNPSLSPTSNPNPSPNPISNPSPSPISNPTPNVPFSQCGKPTPDLTSDSKIIGGSLSEDGSHPWQVSLQARDKGSRGRFSHICGGILISSCWVLTAAHCIDSQREEYQVEIGGSKIHKREDMDQIIRVDKAIVHEKYNDRSLRNDIALLKLQLTDGPYCAKETEFVKAVCLPQQTFPAGKKCVISGWGATGKASYSPDLMDAHVALISKAQCTSYQVYGSGVKEGMLCAGYLEGGIDSCQGDSGGPLVCWDNGSNYITGVVSWGDGCAEKNKPGVYTNVYSYINWIKSKMN